jgi:hypothetical protein
MILHVEKFIYNPKRYSAVGEMTKRLMILLFFLLAVATVAGQDHIIVNSEDWRDVYSTVLYAKLTNTPHNFLVSDRHSGILSQTLSRNKEEILLVESPTTPFVVGYDAVLSNIGFDVALINSPNINLGLAEEVRVRNFIVIDDSYGYNAIAVAPYAVLTDTYVLFSDRRNIDEVVDFLSGRDVQSLIIYGHVDREVKARLEQFDPEIINKEDRFDNNIEIVKRYQEAYKAEHDDINRQVVLSNGEFIEDELMSGEEPVLFLGRQNVPDQIREYISDSGIQIAVLIGNQYVGAATNIRRQIGISVFVKFARGARIPQGAISPVEGLDLFYVPIYPITIRIVGIRYNAATNRLEVTIENTGELGAYFTGSYSLLSEFGAQGTVGDLDPVFIDGESIKTLTYVIEVTGDNLTADAFVLYGESPRSLEYEIRESYTIERVRILDNSQIEIIGLVYDLRRGVFHIKVKNIGEVDAYVDLELIDVIIDGETYSFGSDEVVFIPEGETREIRIRPNPVLTEIDLADNEEITVQANYGEREDTLVKTLRKDLPLTLKRVDYVYYGLVAAVLVLILLLIFVWKKKKCGECGHKNPRRKKHCQKCGAKL